MDLSKPELADSDDGAQRPNKHGFYLLPGCLVDDPLVRLLLSWLGTNKICPILARCLILPWPRGICFSISDLLVGPPSIAAPFVAAELVDHGWIDHGWTRRLLATPLCSCPMDDPRVRLLPISGGDDRLSMTLISGFYRRQISATGRSWCF
ncbi:hypothetical protein ACLOJK_037367 [Asimina triloba]